MASGDHLGGLQDMMANVLQQMAHQMTTDNNQPRPNHISQQRTPPQVTAPAAPAPVQQDTPPQILTHSQESNVEYLTELWADLQRLNPSTDFDHARHVIMREIDRVWAEMCYYDMQYGSYALTDPGLWLPPAHGMPLIIDVPGFVRLEETIPVPTDKYPNYNFIGRILGPRGMSVKQLELETGCRILVRGKGSVRDPRREQRLVGKNGWQHLSLPLHISVAAQAYTKEAANLILQQGVQSVRKLLCPAAKDEKKRRQLMELAIINGNYRPVLYENHVPYA